MATIENFILKFKVEGQQGIKQVSGAIQNLSDDIAAFSGAGGNLGNTLGALLGRLGPVGLAAGAVGTAFVGMGVKAVTLSAQISDLAGATKIYEDVLVNFRTSVIEAGGNSDDFATMITKLNIAIGEAMSGNEKFQDSFRKLGVFVTDAGGNVRDTNDILQDIIARFRDGEITANEFAAAVDILGKNAAKLELEKLRFKEDPAIREQIKALDRMSERYDRLIDQIEKSMVRAFGNLALAMEQGFIPTIIYAVDRVNDLIQSILNIPTDAIAGLLNMLPGVNIEKAVGLGDLYRKVAPPAYKPPPLPSATPPTPPAGAGGKGGGFGATPETVLKANADAERRIRISQAEFERLLASDTQDKIAKIRAQATADITKAEIEIYGREKVSKELMDREFAAKRKEIELRASNEIAQAQRDIQKNLQEQLQSLTQTTDEKLKQFEIERGLFGLSTEQAQRQLRLLEIETNRTKEKEKAAKIAEGDIDAFLKQIDAIDELYDKQAQLIEQQYELQRSFEAGWNTAYQSFIENGTNAAKIAGDSFNALTNNMMSALDKFVETGKLNFGDLARSIILDLMKIQLKAAAVQLFGALTGASGPLSFLGIQQRAIGGPVIAGQAYLTGEQGPELFIPNQSGNIIPNNRLGQSSGLGGNTYITNNISAIDAKSVAQLFAENRMSLLGTVEQARRELPMRTR